MQLRELKVKRDVSCSVRLETKGDVRVGYRGRVAFGGGRRGRIVFYEGNVRNVGLEGIAKT